MSTARKAEAGASRPSIRDRAKVSRAATQRLGEPPAQLAALPTACAVSRIGQRLHEAYEEHLALDERYDVERGVSLQAHLNKLNGVRDELQEAISYGRAGSPAGMLVQLGIAYNAIDLISEGASEEIRGNAMARAERCLMSVAAALCAWTGIDRDGFGAKHLMPVELDDLAVLSPEVG